MLHTLLSPENLGVAIVVALAFGAAALVAMSRLPGPVKLLVYAALALRFVGAYGREAIAKDANVYFRWGSQYAEYFSRFDFSPLWDDTLWRSSNWLGTNFVGYPTGAIIALIGPSKMGTFFAFGLLSFLGILAFAFAYRRAYPRAPYFAFWAWVFLFPSLWFWPSSIGKEAIVILGLGLATLGYAGRNGQTNWPIVVLGLATIYVIRPQVTAIVIFAIMLSFWLDFRGWTPSRMMQGAAILVFGLAGIYFMMSRTLDGEVSVSALQEYVDVNASRNDEGGSSVEGIGSDPSGIPMAMLNVIARPFIWEAHTMNALVSALEIMLMWGLILLRRKQLMAALRHWRTDRMLRFAIPLALIYIIALGMNLSNLGLVARQRTLVLPFIFLIVEAGGAYLRTRPAARPGRPPRPMEKRELVPA
jgi:hypothetical protein